MQEGIVGRRYARALIQSLAGQPQDVLQLVEEQLSATAALLDRREGHGQFRQAMLNPAFAPEQRRAVLAEVGKAHGFHAQTNQFLQLLVEKERVRELPAIATAFRDEVDQQVGRVRATILTAKALSPAALTEIIGGLEKRTGKKIVADVEVDPKVIAGAQARIGGLVFDATVKSQLDRIKAQLSIQ